MRLQLLLVYLAVMAAMPASHIAHAAPATSHAEVSRLPPLPPCPPPPATPGVPPPPVLCEADEQPSGAPEPRDLCLRLESQPSDTVAPGKPVSYTITALNNGSGGADKAAITFHTTSQLQVPLDTSFSRAGPWVSHVTTDTIRLQVGSLEPNTPFTATLRFQVDTDAPLGSALALRARLDWAGRAASPQVWSNSIGLTVDEAPPGRRSKPLTVVPRVGPAGTTFDVTAAGFGGFERISFWYHQPDGQILPLLTNAPHADEVGHVRAAFPTDHLPTGEYKLVAYGHCSMVTAVGQVVIAPD